MADFKRNLSSSAFDTTYIRRQAIKTLERNLVMADYATPGDLPQGEGSTLRWTIDTNLTGATATNALTNDAGTPITYATRDTFNEDTPAASVVNKQIHTYGTFVPVRNQDLKQMPKGMMDRLAKRLAYRGKLTLDTLLRATIDGSGTGFNPSTGAGTTTTRKGQRSGTPATLVAGETLSAEDIALGVNDLLANDAEPFSNGYMAVIIHSVPRGHLITDVSTSRLTWESINKFVSGMSGQEKIPKGIVGGIAGGMVVVSNNITTSTVDTISAYNNIILAQDGLGNVHQDDMKPEVFINQPDKNSTDNPYRIYSTASFLFQAGPTLIDVLRAEVLYTAAT